DVQRFASAHSREVDQGLDDGRRALDGLGRPRQRQAVTAQRDAHTESLRQLEQVAVVHAGERQRVHAFGGETADDVAAHGTTRMWSAAKSASRAGAGAPSNSARAAVVLGKAITSRKLVAPASNIVVRSNPMANPPWGGAPAASALSRNPNRESISAGVRPRCVKILRCTAGSVMRIDPEPSS